MMFYLILLRYSSVFKVYPGNNQRNDVMRTVPIDTYYKHIDEEICEESSVATRTAYRVYLIRYVRARTAL